jgi:hypothetical protein
VMFLCYVIYPYTYWCSCVMSYVPIYLLMYLCYVIYPYTEWCSYVMSYTHIHIDVLVLCHMYPYTYWCSCVMSYTHIQSDVLVLFHILIQNWHYLVLFSIFIVTESVCKIYMLCFIFISYIWAFFQIITNNNNS